MSGILYEIHLVIHYVIVAEKKNVLIVITVAQQCLKMMAMKVMVNTIVRIVLTILSLSAVVAENMAIEVMINMMKKQVNVWD